MSGSTLSWALVGRSVLALVVGVALGVVWILPPASAHSPHDVVVDVELSPDFEQDQTVFAISREYLLTSRDGGYTWTRLVRGLDNRHQPRAIEVSAQDPQVLYLGTRGDGIFRSTDGGSSWSKTAGRLPSLDVRSLAISPTSSDVLFATVEADGSPVAARTDDGGATWRPVPAAGPATTIEFAADDAAVVMSGSEEGQVRMSSDGGATWNAVLDLPDSGGITAMAASQRTSSGRTIFVGTQDEGLYTSTDDARSFAPVGPGITDLSIVSVALSPDFATDHQVWVSTWTTGAFASADAGVTWVERAEGLITDPQADELGRAQFGPLRASPAPDGEDPVLFLAGFSGLFRSLEPDGWSEVQTQVSSNIASLAISPAFGDDQTIAVATYLNGAFLSGGGGDSWTAINEGLAYEHVWTRAEDYYARLISVSFSPSFADDDTLFTSERGYVLRSEDAGAHWEAQIPDGLLVEGENPPDYTLWAFSPDYAADQTIILGSSRGKVFRSTDAGVHFTKIGEAGVPISAIVASPAFGSDQTLIAGTSAGVQRSTDGGQSWERIGLGTTQVTSLALAPDFAESGRIFVGTMAGLFTTDGSTWTPVTGAGLDPAAPIEAVAVSPELEDDGIVLVSVRGRGLFRSVDGGVQFNPTGTELVEDNVVLGNFYHRSTDAIQFSPSFSRDRTVFGTAETSLYRSTDAGETWERLVLPVSTHDMAVDASPSPLLPMIDPADHQQAGADDRSTAEPRGRLLYAAGCAALTFGLLTLVRRQAIRGRRPFASVAVRAAAAGAVLVVSAVALTT